MLKTNIQNNKTIPGFHGEITYTPIDAMPEGQPEKVKTLIVGHSETGHHHVLECDSEFDRIMTDNGIYVLLQQEAKLLHKKDQTMIYMKHKFWFQEYINSEKKQNITPGQKPYSVFLINN